MSENQNNQNQDQHNVGRRTILSGSLGALAGMIFGASEKKAQAQSRPLLEIGGLCDGHIIKLNDQDAIKYMKNQQEKSVQFSQLIRHFTEQGMEFMFERSRVFMYLAESNAGDAAVSPNVIGIIPSFVPFDSTAESHNAVGIVVHQNGKALAGGVHVNHNPFQITEFSVHEVLETADGAAEIMSNRISAEELEQGSVEEIARSIEIPRENPETLDPNAATLRNRDREAVAAFAFQAMINDDVSRPMYTPEGLEALLAQTPLVQKFANVNYLRYQQAMAAAAGWCCSTSSSCNASSSTSTSTSISVDLAAG